MLTIKELSDKYDIGETTIRRWIKGNKLLYTTDVINHKKVIVVAEDSLRNLLLQKLGTTKSTRRQRDMRGAIKNQLADVRQHLYEIEKILESIMNS